MSILDLVIKPFMRTMLTGFKENSMRLLVTSELVGNHNGTVKFTNIYGRMGVVTLTQEEYIFPDYEKL